MKGDGTIQGIFDCTSNNENANEDTDEASSGSGGGGGKDDDENSASGVVFNSALFALVAVAGLASAL